MSRFYGSLCILQCHEGLPALGPVQFTVGTKHVQELFADDKQIYSLRFVMSRSN